MFPPPLLLLLLSLLLLLLPPPVLFPPPVLLPPPALFPGLRFFQGSTPEPPCAPAPIVETSPFFPFSLSFLASFLARLYWRTRLAVTPFPRFIILPRDLPAPSNAPLPANLEPIAPPTTAEVASPSLLPFFSNFSPNGLEIFCPPILVAPIRLTNSLR